MKWLQSLFILVFSVILLMYLWPLLLVFLAIIAYQLYKASKIVKQAYHEAAQPDSQDNFETFRQNASSDVIDADYTERSNTDGPQ